MNSDAAVRDVIDEFHAAVQERKPYEEVWDDIDTNLLPNITKLAESSTPLRGQRNDEKINDGGPRYALSTFQAGFMGRMMSKGFDWFTVQAPDEAIMDDRETRMWLSKLNQAIFMLVNRSMFFPQAYCLFGVGGGMGTATMYHYFNVVKQSEVFQLMNPWSIYLVDDEDGINDTVFRLNLMSPKNMVGAFKNDNLSDEIVRLNTDATSRIRETIQVLHATKPNPKYDPRKRDKTVKKYSSWYIDLERESVIRPGGYSSMPYSTWALEKEANEPYGRGPGWRALADVKALYATNKTNMTGAQYQVNPAMDIPRERQAEGFTQVPGGNNFYDELGRHPIAIQKSIDLKAGLEQQQRKQVIIERAFMVPFFTTSQQALVGDRKERTAYEVRQMEQEAAILLGPYATGFQAQFMNRVIEGLIYDVMENRMVPPPPIQLMQSLNGRRLEVIYSGPLALAEKAFFNTEPYRRTLADIQLMMSVDPTGQNLPRQIMDIPNWDKFFKELGQGNGLPEEASNEERTIQATRKARAQAIEQQRKLAAMESAGKAAGGLNQAPQPGSPADAMNKQGAPVAS